MKERLLIILAAMALLVTVLQPVLPAAPLGETPALHRTQSGASVAPDSDCQGGGQCST